MGKRKDSKFRSWLRKALGRERIPKFYRGRAKFLERYPNYEIGYGTYGLPFVHDWHEGTTLRIGSYTSIADDVHIFLGGHHRTDWVASFPFPAFLEEAAHIASYGGSHGDVNIGNDVWLASGCTILSGVTVGDGAVVAARAVVTKDVAPYSIVAGNPARHVRFRFEEETRAALLASAWWTWPESEVREIVALLCSTDVSAFLDYAYRRAGQTTSGANG
ncbi:CatB-related O-acetyltransferase [Propionivibrio soli]|uniref:CatB-related O-acetyltransferase n=1 Tax=Propionivibrio soli TaxID=2976531 RepID=UPI0021E891B2|nr:CatB-related O-acetyltransferase [Propionivibrio soli]